MPGIDDSRQFLPLRIAVLTVSDTRDLADDKSGALLCERHGLAPADCIFIDDSLPNVEGAQAFGMQGHHFLEPSALRADLKARGLPLA